MANYSAEEIRAFKLKDILNSRMSALKAAATNHEGHALPSEKMRDEADAYYEWLRQDQDDVGGTCPTLGSDTGTTLGQVPEPTLAQKKVLDAIHERTPFELLHDTKLWVLDWAKAVYGERNYPTKVSSVDLFMKWLELQN